VDRRPPSHRGDDDAYLVEPSLYLDVLSIPTMHAELQEALAEAVRCFRAKLYTAGVAMLGKASEGAWLELGAAAA
jgi:hypothetical protein